MAVVCNVASARDPMIMSARGRALLPHHQSTWQISKVNT